MVNFGRKDDSKLSSRKNSKQKFKFYHPKNNLHNNFDVGFMDYHFKMRKRQAFDSS